MYKEAQFQAFQVVTGKNIEDYPLLMMNWARCILYHQIDAMSSFQHFSTFADLFVVNI